MKDSSLDSHLIKENGSSFIHATFWCLSKYYEHPKETSITSLRSYQSNLKIIQDLKSYRKWRQIGHLIQWLFYFGLLLILYFKSFLQGDFGPFDPGLPVCVPIWIAVDLKQKSKCKIHPPEWLNLGMLMVQLLM